jgi:hypothetical protein
MKLLPFRDLSEKQVNVLNFSKELGKKRHFSHFPKILLALVLLFHHHLENIMELDQDDVALHQHVLASL